MVITNGMYPCSTRLQSLFVFIMIYMLLLYTRSPCHQCSTTLSAPLTAACTVWHVPFDCGRASDPGPWLWENPVEGIFGVSTAQYTRRYTPTAFWVLANANDSAILSREGAPRVKEQRSRRGNSDAAANAAAELKVCMGTWKHGSLI